MMMLVCKVMVDLVQQLPGWAKNRWCKHNRRWVEPVPSFVSACTCIIRVRCMAHLLEGNVWVQRLVKVLLTRMD